MNEVDITAWGSMVVALCALLLTIWQIRRQQNHERVINTPFLISQITDLLKDGNIAVCVQGIRNDGLGPAKITLYQPEVNGKACSLREMVTTVLGETSYRLDHMSDLAVGTSIASGAERTLAQITIKVSTQEEIDVVRGKFAHARIRVKYQSFYDDETYELVVGD